MQRFRKLLTAGMLALVIFVSPILAACGGGGGNKPPAPIFTATISDSSHIFAEATEGYGTQSAKTFTVTNTGNQPLAGVSTTMGFSIHNAFYISTPLSSTTIAIGGTATFSVRPRVDLVAGIYNNSIVVNWNNSPSGSGIGSNLSFTVNPFIEILEATACTTSHTFRAWFNDTWEELQKKEKTFTITNTGNQVIHNLSSSFENWNANLSFGTQFDKTTLEPGEFTTVSVYPDSSTTAGTFTDKLIIEWFDGWEDIDELVIDLTYIVTEQLWDIEACVPFHDFGFVSEAGYPVRPWQEFTITNVGNQIFENITTSFNAHLFEFEGGPVCCCDELTLGVGESFAIKVRPISNLLMGVHQDTVFVSGINVIDLVFEVGQAAEPTAGLVFARRQVWVGTHWAQLDEYRVWGGHGAERPEIQHAVIPALHNGLPVTLIEDMSVFTNLVSLRIPATVNSFGMHALYPNTLTTIIVSEWSPYFSSEGGVLYNKEKTEIVAVPRGMTSLTIPNTVTSIGNGSFINSAITTLTIPNTITSIGNEAFRYSAIANLTIPNSVTNLGQGIFRDCAQLVTVVLPSNMTAIPDNMFHGSSLQHITIPDSVKIIGNHSFEFTNLTSIIIPEGVTTIGSSAFAGGWPPFGRLMAITSITLPSTLTSIGENAFSLTELTSIEIPSGITVIESNTFFGSLDLASVTLPNTVTEIRSAAFGFTNLASIVMEPREGYVFRGWFTAAEGGTRLTINQIQQGLAGFAQWRERGLQDELAGSWAMIRNNNVADNGNLIVTMSEDGTASVNIWNALIDSRTNLWESDGETIQFFENETLRDEWAVSINPQGQMILFRNLYGNPQQLTFVRLGDVGAEHTVTFSTQGGSLIDSQIINVGTTATATRPSDPTLAGHFFLGWFTHPTAGIEFDFVNMLITGDTDLYARWSDTDPKLQFAGMWRFVSTNGIPAHQPGMVFMDLRPDGSVVIRYPNVMEFLQGIEASNNTWEIVSITNNRIHFSGTNPSRDITKTITVTGDTLVMSLTNFGVPFTYNFERITTWPF